MDKLRRLPSFCRAARVGSEAQRLLGSSGFRGTVLAVVSESVYLQGDAGEILWLQRGGLPMHRRSILAPFPPFPFEPGGRFSLRRSCLCVGEETAIDLTHAAKWDPKSIKAGEEIPLARLRIRVRKLFSALPGLGNPTGFGQALPVLSAIGMDRPAPHFETDALVKGAIHSMAEAAEGCLAGDLTRAIQRSRDFIGLGRGLTPSGDDFVGALFFTVRALRNSYPGDVPWDGKAVNDLIAWAAKQTNPISYVLLNDLALGEGPEPLHELFHAVVSGKDLNIVSTSLHRLIQIGSTSGWDMLTGFMTGLLTIGGPLN